MFALRARLQDSLATKHAYKLSPLETLVASITVLNEVCYLTSSTPSFVNYFKIILDFEIMITMIQFTQI